MSGNWCQRLRLSPTHTEAQEDSLTERLSRLRDHVTSAASTLLEKSKAVAEDISTNEYVVKSKYAHTHARTRTPA